jgi:hypothetical protein
MPGTYKSNSHYCHRKHQEEHWDDTGRKAEMDVAGNQRGDSRMPKGGQYQGSSTTVNLLSYKRLKARVRRLMKDARKKSWEEFTKSINEETTTSEIWEKTRRISGKTHRIIRLRTPDCCRPKVDRKHARRIKRIKRMSLPQINQEEYNSLLTEEESETVLSSVTGSSPGPDEIHYELLKQMGRPERMKLLGLFNNIWKIEKFPTESTKATMIPIWKSGKYPNKSENIQPISLTSCICKIMRRMVKKNWPTYYKTVDCYPIRNTVSEKINLQRTCWSRWKRSSHRLCRRRNMLDISKVYDTCWRLGSIRKLKDWNQRGDSKMPKVETTISTITDNSKPTLIQNTEGKGTKADERSTKKIMGKAYEINKQRRPRCGKKFEEYLEKHIE